MNFGPSLYPTFDEMLMQGRLVLCYEGDRDYNYLLKIKNSIPALAVHHKFIATLTKVAPLRGVPEVGHPMADRGLPPTQAWGRAIVDQIY